MYPEVKRLATQAGRHRLARDGILVPDDLYLIYWNRFHGDFLRVINAIILRCFSIKFTRSFVDLPHGYSTAIGKFKVLIKLIASPPYLV